MAGGAGGDACIAADRLGGGVVRLWAVTTFAVDPGTIAGLVASEAAGGVVCRLGDALGLVEVGGGLERMAGSKAEFVGCGIPTEAVFDPAFAIAKHGGAGEVAGAEQPGEREGTGGFAGLDDDSRGVEGIRDAAAFA